MPKDNDSPENDMPKEEQPEGSSLFWDSVMSFMIFETRSNEERLDLLLAFRVMVLIFLFIAFASVTNSYILDGGDGGDDGAAFAVFFHSLPMITLSVLFGVFGAITRSLASELEEVRQRQFRNMLAGGILGSVSFLFTKSQVISQVVYQSQGLNSDLKIDPYGAMLVAFLVGMFAPEVVGYAKGKVNDVANRQETDTTKTPVNTKGAADPDKA